MTVDRVDGHEVWRGVEYWLEPGNEHPSITPILQDEPGSVPYVRVNRTDLHRIFTAAGWIQTEEHVSIDHVSAVADDGAEISRTRISGKFGERLITRTKAAPHGG